MSLVATCASRTDDVPASAEAPRAAYTYDDLGRLRSVTDDSGRTAVYEYDGVGNVVGIDRTGAAPYANAPDRPEPPSVSGLSAEVVAVGDTLTIEGTHFDDDPSLDAVVFGGTTYAPVESASTTELVVRVPPTAPSGRVTVATPDGSDRSRRGVFVVPAGIDVDDLTTTKRLGLGDEVTVDIGEGSAALLTFRAERGQRVELVETKGEGLCFLALGLYAPGGIELIGLDDVSSTMGRECMAGRDLGALPTTGLYTLVLAPLSVGATTEVETRTVAVEEAADDGDDADRATTTTTVEEDAAFAVPEGVDPALLEPPDIEDTGPSAMPGGVVDGSPAFPVDLTTGRLVFEQTDLVLPDLVPVELARTYQPTGRLPSPLDKGAFGLGSFLDLDLRLRTSPGFQFADLVLPSGVPLNFVRTSDGSGDVDAEFVHTATATSFYRATITWNGQGWDLTLTDGTTLVFAGRRDSPLVAIHDRNGNQVTLARSPEDDRVITSVSTPSGRAARLEYDAEGRVTAVVDHLGRTTTYGYDDPGWAGRLASVTYPSGAAVAYGYDEDGHVVSVTGPDGVAVVANVYDQDGRVVRQVLADGSAYGFAYRLDEAGGVAQTEVTDPTGAVRRLEVAAGQWTSDTLAAGTPAERTVRVERDPASGFVTAVVGPDGRRTTYGYDPAGNLTSQSGPAELVTDATYAEAFQQVESVSDSAGQSASFEYDRAGNLTASDDSYGGRTRFRYDRQGRVVAVTDPAGGTTTVDYELAHRETVTDPGGGETSRFFDAAGRLAVVTDALGHRTRLRYDELDRLVSVDDPAGGETAFAYDAAGRLVSLTDADGHATTYGYDGAGRVVSRTDPVGATETFAYDPFGNVTAHADRRGVVSTFGYDAAGRLGVAAFGVGLGADGGPQSTVSYGYDPAGRLVSVADSAYGTVDLAYDDLDRLVRETTPQGEVTYTYDDAGRRSRRTITSGPSTTYRYDGSGRLESIRQDDMTVSFTRDALGRLWDVMLPHDVTETYSFDERGLVAGVDYGVGDGSGSASASGTAPELGRLGYRYDDNGRRVGATGDFGAVRIPAATPASSPSGASSSASAPPVEHDEANRRSDLVYDAAGNVTGDGANTYAWDARGQLVAVAGSMSATFAYDPFGRRVAKTVDGTTTSYLYDGVNIAGQTVGSDDQTWYLTGFGPDEVYARDDGSSVTSYLRDGLGSVVGLVGEDGEIATRYSYDPFGRTRVSGRRASDPNPFAYTGRELDETGLYYYRARYYDPERGRFLSEDPLGYAAGDPNLYAYVGNDPVNMTDPSGMQPGFGCTLPGLDLLERAMALVDQYTAVLGAWGRGELTQEQVDVATDNLLRSADDAQSQFIVACGADVVLLPALSPLIGRGLGSFGRWATTRFPNATARLTHHFPTLSTRWHLTPADDLPPNRVYRGLAAGEDPAIGLTARAPGIGNTPASHVAGARQTQWISTTRSQTIAEETFGKYGVVEIDLARLSSTTVDVSGGIPGLPPNAMLSNWARKYQEVLVLDEIPPKAIRGIIR